MKKLITLIATAIFALNVSAQTINFMGIPIEGSQAEFTSKLKAKGFKATDEPRYLKGEFIGESASVLLQLTPNSNQVYGVTVVLSPETTWSSYVVKINELKNLFSQKYGTPEKIEQYSYPYKKGDGYEMTALRSGKLLYGYKFTNGIIIGVSGTVGILISYTNKAIEEAAKQEQTTSNLGDI